MLSDSSFQLVSPGYNNVSTKTSRKIEFMYDVIVNDVIRSKSDLINQYFELAINFDQSLR